MIYNDVQQMCILVFGMLHFMHWAILNAKGYGSVRIGKKGWFSQNVTLLSPNQVTLELGLVGAVCNYPIGLRSDR